MSLHHHNNAAGRHLPSPDAAHASPPPIPVVYATSADIRSKPYEGERSLAALLHMDDLLPRTLSFLTPVELLFVSCVSRAWQRHASTAKQTLCRRLHLGQFWSRLGLLPDAHFLRMASQFQSCTELNVAYCSFMPGSTLRSLLHAMPALSRLTKLNLFYCYQLTDADLEAILLPAAPSGPAGSASSSSAAAAAGASPPAPVLPALRDLNLGRCSKLTERGVRLLSEARCLPALSSLSLAHLACVGEDTLMLFDDTRNFPSLSTLNVMHCTKWSTEHVEELLRGAAAPGGRNSLLAKQGKPPLKIIGPLELFQVDKSGKKMRKEIDADT